MRARPTDRHQPRQRGDAHPARTCPPERPLCDAQACTGPTPRSAPALSGACLAWTRVTSPIPYHDVLPRTTASGHSRLPSPRTRGRTPRAVSWRPGTRARRRRAAGRAAVWARMHTAAPGRAWRCGSPRGACASRRARSSRRARARSLCPARAWVLPGRRRRRARPPRAWRFAGAARGTAARPISPHSAVAAVPPPPDDPRRCVRCAMAAPGSGTAELPAHPRGRSSSSRPATRTMRRGQPQSGRHTATVPLAGVKGQGRDSRRGAGRGGGGRGLRGGRTPLDGGRAGAARSDKKRRPVSRMQRAGSPSRCGTTTTGAPR